MRRLSHIALLGAVTLVALAARDPGLRADPEAPPPSGREILGAIDFVPQRDDLVAAMVAAFDELSEIAQDSAEDPGIRIRAIRALSQWPEIPAAQDVLRTLIQDRASVHDGVEVLYLRAAIEALAEIGGTDEVPVIAPFLNAGGDNPENAELGQDLRATAARALGVIRSAAAVGPLEARRAIEQTDQVKFAITEALRAILGS